MSFDDLCNAVLALPEDQRIELLDFLTGLYVHDDGLTPAQKADLLQRERELALDPLLGEDGDIVLDRLKCKNAVVTSVPGESK